MLFLFNIIKNANNKNIMKHLLTTIESKILNYLLCVQNNVNYTLILLDEIKQAVSEIKDYTSQQVLVVFKSLQELEYIKIIYQSRENFLIELTNKGKNFTNNSKLKNSYNFRNNRKFCNFFLSFISYYLATILAIITCLFIYNYVK